MTNLAVSALVANAVSKNVAGAGLVEFFTSKDGGGSSFVITLPELINSIAGGAGGVYGPTAAKYGIDQTAFGVMKHNIAKNWMPLTVAVVGIPVVANIATKLLRKPVILPANRLIKNTLGLKDVKI